MGACFNIHTQTTQIEKYPSNRQIVVKKYSKLHKLTNKEIAHFGRLCKCLNSSRTLGFRDLFQHTYTNKPNREILSKQANIKYSLVML